MGSRRRLPVLTLLFLAAVVAGCGSEGDSGAPAATASPQGASPQKTLEARLVALERASFHQRRAAYLERVRRAVIRGLGRDFAAGTGIGGPLFESCVKGLLRETLEPPQISNLAAVYRRPDGAAYAAQALNALVAPLAADCGHRYWVPELVDAARGLAIAHTAGAAARNLGVTYGPYLGIRCHGVGHRGCNMVGVDIVFRHAATRVLALVGDRRIHLRTPGEHDRIPYRDWVGTFTHAGFGRHDSPFHLGDQPVYVGVELAVRFADGHRARALFPHVLLSSGWG